MNISEKKGLQTRRGLQRDTGGRGYFRCRDRVQARKSICLPKSDSAGDLRRSYSDRRVMPPGSVHGGPLDHTFRGWRPQRAAVAPGDAETL